MYCKLELDIKFLKYILIEFQLYFACLHQNLLRKSENHLFSVENMLNLLKAALNQSSSLSIFQSAEKHLHINNQNRLTCITYFQKETLYKIKISKLGDVMAQRYVSTLDGWRQVGSNLTAPTITLECWQGSLRNTVKKIKILDLSRIVYSTHICKTVTKKIFCIMISNFQNLSLSNFNSVFSSKEVKTICFLLKICKIYIKQL